jgi:acyl carrier protein
MLDEVKSVLAAVLHIGPDRTDRWTGETRLLGELLELDSLAIVNVLAGLEERFGIHIADDDISADVFESLGTVCSFIEEQRRLIK